MRFVTCAWEGRETPAVYAEDGSLHPLEGFATLLSFIQGHGEKEMAALRERIKRPGISAEGLPLLAPIPRPHHDVLCLGLNYMDHVKEGITTLHKGEEVDLEREEAVYFSKRVLHAVGPGGEIPAHADILPGVDYEAELAVVIGKDASHVAPEDAWEHVFGLMAFNDLSGRTLQKKHKQWYFGKSLDGFTACGPYIATLDEFAFPLALSIESRVNGETRQSSNTSHMIFTVEQVISELSSGLTLDAGSIIATGTPAGVGAAFTPPRLMHPGDVVEVEIEGCGILRNTVVG